MARYLIGIDLGTTNSALAYIDLASGKAGSVAVPSIRPFPMPQLVAPAEVAPRPLLPSFLYLPGAHDLPPGATALPWNPQCDYAVGEFARRDRPERNSANAVGPHCRRHWLYRYGR